MADPWGWDSAPPLRAPPPFLAPRKTPLRAHFETWLFGLSSGCQTYSYTFLVNGTWAAPVGTISLSALVIGAGGQGANASFSANGGGGGGGGSAYTPSCVIAGGNYTIIVGTSSGSSSTVLSPAAVAQASATGGGNATGSTGAAGGTGTVGTFLASGTDGITTVSLNGGGGGTGADASGGGHGGTGGAGGDNTNGYIGQPGLSYGGGGGGGGNNAGTGGIGGNGVVILTWSICAAPTPFVPQDTTPISPTRRFTLTGSLNTVGETLLPLKPLPVPLGWDVPVYPPRKPLGVEKQVIPPTDPILIFKPPPTKPDILGWDIAPRFMARRLEPFRQDSLIELPPPAPPATPLYGWYLDPVPLARQRIQFWGTINVVPAWPTYPTVLPEPCADFVSPALVGTEFENPTILCGVFHAPGLQGTEFENPTMIGTTFHLPTMQGAEYENPAICET